MTPRHASVATKAAAPTNGQHRVFDARAERPARRDLLILAMLLTLLGGVIEIGCR